MFFKVTTQGKVRSKVKIVTFAFLATETGIITAANPNSARMIPKG